MPNSQNESVGDFSSTSSREPVIQKIRYLHTQQLALCDKLESIADRLPDSIDPQDMLLVAQQIFPLVNKAHKFEEETVFRLLQKNLLHAPDIEPTIERLRFEHWEDESFAQELQESMTGYVTGQTPKRPDTLSYMLRGFFEGMRRHIAFETEHLLPILARC